MPTAARPRMTSAAPLLRSGGELHIVGRQDVLTLTDPDGAMLRLLQLADGSRDTDELVCALTADYPRLGERDVVDVVSRLRSLGLLEDVAAGRRPVRRPAATIYD